MELILGVIGECDNLNLAFFSCNGKMFVRDLEESDQVKLEKWRERLYFPGSGNGLQTSFPAGYKPQRFFPA
jgi:hypothetical protein